jgi:polysaccharide pyruvyl transferase WcaK-like protein
MLDAGAIGLNLSPLLARYRASPEGWTAQAADLLKALLSTVDSPVLLIPHVMYPGNDDASFLADVLQRAEADPARVQLLSGYRLSSRHLKYVISRLRAFVGARTHATIASLSTNVPTLSIGYSVKARGINEDLFGHDRWLVHHLELDPKILASKVRDLLAAEAAVRAHLSAQNATYRIDGEAVRSLLS